VLGSTLSVVFILGLEIGSYLLGDYFSSLLFKLLQAVLIPSLWGRRDHFVRKFFMLKVVEFRPGLADVDARVVHLGSTSNSQIECYHVKRRFNGGQNFSSLF